MLTGQLLSYSVVQFEVHGSQFAVERCTFQSLPRSAGLQGSQIQAPGTGYQEIQVPVNRNRIFRASGKTNTVGGIRLLITRNSGSG